MSVVRSLWSPCAASGSDPNADAGQVSLETFPADRLEALVDLILDTVEPESHAQFYGWVLSGRSHIQARQCEALAKYGRVSTEAARLWLKGVNTCPGGRLYAFTRMRFGSEVEMARAFGEFVGRDFVAEAQR